MYVHWKLFGVCLATCAAALLVSNDAGNGTHVAAGEGAERGAAARSAEVHPVVRRMAAIARRRWGAKSCVEFNARLVNEMDAGFTRQIQSIAMGKECFKHWMSERCHNKMKELLSHTVFASVWGLAMWPLDAVWKSVMYVSGGFVESTAWPLLDSTLDAPITRLQERIQNNEGKFVAYEEMYEENLDKALVADTKVTTFLKDHIASLCKVLGLVEEGEDVDAMVAQAMNKAEARSARRASHASTHHAASDD